MTTKTKTKTTPKVDAYQVITDRIVAALEEGTVPWLKPWRSLSGFGPTSLSTGREYRGINSLMLSMEAMSAGYSSLYWGTYRQIAEIGGQVRKGEHGTQVVLWRPVEKKVAGQETPDRFLLMKLFVVFNADQCDWEDGKEPVEPAKPESTFSPVEAAEAIANGMPQRPEIKHGGDRAFYSPLLDYVGMPPQEAFDNAEGYYSTLFHELVHSTGHASRVGRDGIEAFAGFGTESYSREELIAEMGAAYLCAEAGIEPRIEQNAAYIASWLKVLKNDKKFVVGAAAGAGKATDWILDRKREEGK